MSDILRSAHGSEAGPPRSASGYRAEIDGLRALALLPVILFHAGFSWCSGGYVGVDVFFVISGYLITSIILLERESGTFSIRRFYERRARRILPALFVVVVVCVPFAWLLMLPGELEAFSKGLVAITLFGSNILFWRESGYFQLGVDTNPLIHMWSLSVEEQFYLAFPVLLTFPGMVRRRRMIVVLGLATVASLLLGEWGSRNAAIASFYLLPTRAWELLVGALIACYLLRSAPPERGREFLSLAGMGLILLAAASFDYKTPVPGFFATIPVAGAALIIIFANEGTRVARLLGHPILAGIGLISYSAYLWHQPLFAFTRLRIDAPPASLQVALTALSLALGWLSWRFIERPFRDKLTFSGSQILAGALVGSVLIFGVGAVGAARAGFPGRFDSRTLRILAQKERPEPFMGKCVDDYFEVMGGEPCVLGARHVKPTIVVWGDSHAASLAFGLDSLLAKEGRSAVQLTSGACPPIGGVTRLFRGRPALNCARNNEAALRLIERLKPEYVLISSRWTLNLTGRRFDNQEGGEEPGEPAVVVDLDGVRIHGEDLLKVYREELSALRAKVPGRIILISQIPEAGWDVPKRALWSDSNEKGEVKTSYAVFEERNRLTNRLMDSLRGGGISIFQAERAFCDDRQCYNTADGIPLYSDTNHLSKLGSERLVELLAAEFRRGRRT